MRDDVLSKEEFDALLQERVPGEPAADLHTVVEALRLSLQEGAQHLGQLVEQAFGVDVVNASLQTLGELRQADSKEWVAVELDLTGGFDGVFVLLLYPEVANRIGQALAGTDESTPLLDPDTIDGLAEALEEFAIGLGERLAAIVDKKITVQSGAPTVVDLGGESPAIPIGATESFLACELSTELGGEAGESGDAGYLLVPIDVHEALQVALSHVGAGVEQSAAALQVGMERASRSNEGKASRPAVRSAAAVDGGVESRSVYIEPAEFEQLAPSRARETVSENIDLLLDVPLEITVELGRAQLQIRDILNLSKGQVLELDKLAGEPVDVFVNGKLMAKGEVVVMAENFGVKIVSIISRRERVQNLG